MSVSNSVFFTVRPQPQLNDVGWTVRVLDYANFSTPVAVISEYIELSVGPELCDPGAGSITLDADHPMWLLPLMNGHAASTLLDHEYLWECYQDGELRFQFLGTTVEEHLLDDDETRAIVISGPGAAQVLAWATILPAYFPPAKEVNQTVNTTDPAGNVTVWPGFATTWSAMRIWRHLLLTAQSRGTIPYVTCMFSDSKDSAGQAWEVVQTVSTVADPGTPITPDPGTNLLDLLNIHTGQDLAKQFAERTEWYMWPGFKLDVRKTIGTHREADVVFFETQTVGKERTRNRAEIGNYIVGADVNGSTSFVADTASIAAWQQREMLQYGNKEVTDPARRAAITNVFLGMHKDEQDQWTITVPYDEPGRKAFVDYGIGDWISVATFKPDGSSSIDAYRVLAIIVKSVDAAPPTVELTLRSKIEERLRKLQQQLTNIINDPKGSIPEALPKLPVYPDFPAGGGLVTYDPNTGKWGVVDPSLGGTGGGTTDFGLGGGIRMFIQPTDPAGQASVGDMWLQTYPTS